MRRFVLTLGLLGCLAGGAVTDVTAQQRASASSRKKTTEKATKKPSQATPKPVVAPPQPSEPAEEVPTGNEEALVVPKTKIPAFVPPLEPRAVPTSAMLNGLWKGPLKVLGGQLDVSVSIVPLTGGQYFGALDVPAQKVSRMATAVVVRADSVLLDIPEADSRFAARFVASPDRLIGIWTRSGIAAPVALLHSALPVATVSSNRLAPPYREEEVLFSNPVSRLRLAGTFTVPAGPGPFPAVVLLSDVGAQDRDGTVGDYHLLGSLADYLTRRGIAVLRCDDRGVGLSEGNTEAATTTMRVTDVQAAMNFLRTRLEVKINRIGIVGHGEGGNIGLLAASQPLPPAFVVAMAAYGLRGQQTLLEQQSGLFRTQKMTPTAVQAAYERQRTMYDIIRQTTPEQGQAIVSNMLRQDQPTLDAAAAQVAAAKILTPWRRDFLGFDPIAHLAEVQCPVLLLSGTADAEAPSDRHLTALEQELKSANRVTTVRRLPGVNHLFQPPQSEWSMVSGQLRPILSPVALEAMREWIAGPVKK